jgi:ATP-dependent DNA helicase RecQ
MQAWMQEEVQVIVATNAFEWDRQTKCENGNSHTLPEHGELLPRSWSADVMRKSFCNSTHESIGYNSCRKSVLNNLPDKKFLNLMYVKLCNYFQIA